VKVGKKTAALRRGEGGDIFSRCGDLLFQQTLFGGGRGVLFFFFLSKREGVCAKGSKPKTSKGVSCVLGLIYFMGRRCCFGEKNFLVVGGCVMISYLPKKFLKGTD